MFIFCLILAAEPDFETFSVFNTNDNLRMSNVKYVASKEIRSLCKIELYP